MSKKIEVGTRVRFAAKFLRSIGDYTERGHYRGEVVELIDLGGGLVLADVQWKHGARGRVNVNNLIREDRVHLEI